MQSEASTRPPGDEESSRSSGPSGHAIIRFAAFELHKETRELFKQGTRIRLQIKPFQVLETLLERPGELVTREELRNRLWPSGTFVDFESGLNTATNRLRSALGDSADEPRYIETLPRLGYRFICPVEVVERETHSELVPAAAHPEPESVPLELESSVAVPSAATAAPNRSLPLWIAAGCVAIAATLLAISYTRSYFRSMADFKLINFRGSGVVSARFLSDSEVIYSARLDGKWQTLVAKLDGSDVHSLPVDGVLIAASNQGDLALSSAEYHKSPFRIEHASLNGGPETPLVNDGTDVDWGPHRDLALIRQRGGESFVEFPAGNVIYRSEGWLNNLRVSHDGNRVAFLEHVEHDDDAGHVRVVDRSGATRVISPEFGSAEGLAWEPHDREVWFTAAKEGATRSLYSATLDGRRLRRLSPQPLSLRLLDVSASGHALVAADENRLTVRTAVAGEESDITQFDYTDVNAISHDGRMLLLTESGDAGGQHYAAFVYDLNSRNARRFGTGRALALSPDDSQALTVDPQEWTVLTITCLKTGRSTRVPSSGFRYQWGHFVDRNRLLIGGSYKGQPLIMAYEDLPDGRITPIEGAPFLDDVVVSPDGTRVAGYSSGIAELFDLNEKSTERLSMEGRPIGWGRDRDTIFLLSEKPGGSLIMAYNFASRQCAPWKTIVPRDSGAFAGFAGVALSPATDTYAYSAHLKLSRLYLVNGLL